MALPIVMSHLCDYKHICLYCLATNWTINRADIYVFKYLRGSTVVCFPGVGGRFGVGVGLVGPIETCYCYIFYVYRLL